MEPRRRPNMGIGILLVLLGAWFLVDQFVPGFRFWINTELSWPVLIIGVGGLILLIGLLTWSPEMATPACVVAGIGGILYYQNLTGDWESWSYLWTLIPGFAGVGGMLSGMLRGNFGPALRSGFGSILFSLVLFGIFSSLFGGPVFFGPYWPVLLILLGVYILLSQLFRKRDVL